MPLLSSRLTETGEAAEAEVVAEGKCGSGDAGEGAGKPEKMLKRGGSGFPTIPCPAMSHVSHLPGEMACDI